MQLSLQIPTKLAKEAYDFGNRTSGEVHGVVLTKPHIVDLILDLVGYTPQSNLSQKRILEPSCGTGAFLIPAVNRLLQSSCSSSTSTNDLQRAVLSFDIDIEHVKQTREDLKKVLSDYRIRGREAETLVNNWVLEGDFLLDAVEGNFDFIVGNPPYIRIEQLSAQLQSEYRARYCTLYDRADIYVAFIERCLGLLSEQGMLSFICADRWTKNRYGKVLREIVSEKFRISTYIDLSSSSPFESDVIAYPSIFNIGRGKTKSVHFFKMTKADKRECEFVANKIVSKDSKAECADTEYEVIEEWFTGNSPWVLGSASNLKTLRFLEDNFPRLEEEGDTRVGIGVATGNDKLYIVNKNTDIEKDRLIPLVMRGDIVDGVVQPSEKCVINTFRSDGGTVDLNKYPKLSSYFRSHMSEIKKRHVAQKNPNSWFRTIDRVYPELVSIPKLLIPDIAGSNEIALDEGHYHPHHNLYFVASREWDMEVLGGILSSKMALFFVWSYAVKMRGGYLRFQAQYLRRIRVPRIKDISTTHRKLLKKYFRNRDFQSLDRLSIELYNVEKMPEFDFVDTRQ